MTHGHFLLLTNDAWCEVEDLGPTGQGIPIGEVSILLLGIAELRLAALPDPLYSHFTSKTHKVLHRSFRVGAAHQCQHHKVAAIGVIINHLANGLH